jgi:hypothetical protein
LLGRCLRVANYFREFLFHAARWIRARRGRAEDKVPQSLSMIVYPTCRLYLATDQAFEGAWALKWLNVCITAERALTDKDIR